jgi:UDPglucose 6-dehydrogenase
MNIAVIGTGYVGLVSGAGFAEFGHVVTCVDIDAARIAALQRGEIPIHEPNLPELVRRHRANGRLRFTTSAEGAVAVAAARVVFIAVGTPSDDTGAADLRHVFGAARDVGRALARFTVVVTKSTVPVGTTDRVRALIAGETRQPFAVASNPEFLKEGDAVNDFMKPPRIVVGTDDPRAVEIMRELYQPVMRTNDRMLVMDPRSAELTKYAANAMLATRISFMNELARLAEAVGADIDLIRKGVGSDPRIGPKFLFAGCGFGGSCFPKDLRALIDTGREHDVPLTIVQAVERANERQKLRLGAHVVAHFGGSLAGRRIGVWGLAFKPETDDIRESPALALIAQLREAGAAVAAYDPAAMPNVRAALADAIELAPDPYAAARGADALVLVTEWHELRNPDLDRLKACMKELVLFDGRNVWSPPAARGAGFTYHGIGRP